MDMGVIQRQLGFLEGVLLGLEGRPRELALEAVEELDRELGGKPAEKQEEYAVEHPELDETVEALLSVAERAKGGTVYEDEVALICTRAAKDIKYLRFELERLLFDAYER